MDYDQTFRIVLIVGALIVFPIMAYHRLKSQATGETLDRWQEGRFILFTLRPVGVAAMVGLLAFMINPSGWRGRPCGCQSGCGGQESAWASLPEDC